MEARRDSSSFHHVRYTILVRRYRNTGTMPRKNSQAMYDGLNMRMVSAGVVCNTLSNISRLKYTSKNRLL